MNINIEILGEEKIGFWHLMDQILLLEDFSKRLQEANWLSVVNIIRLKYFVYKSQDWSLDFDFFL